ncbi:30S ribosome-binding factor RbfA [Frigidibacter sp. ROC022]|uniref:30S ribosome-binding factor RbfA n=1 Tax=Frigidibacter sp. ROC022 TaxID=2971796 RepID=UPI00215A6BE0|nr:30S ribosome-binding factor RbfA [Frigidibacter sp. ROC022]MCR8725904.1 30S ribosome-binding factor RbfA [Frigidibacter sp. ROC022]
MARGAHPHSGPSQRQLRVGELIRRTLSDVLQKGEIHDPDLNRIPITVGEVVVTSDLKIATAYVLPLGGQGRDEMLDALRRNRFELRRAVTRAMTLKYSPELKFAIDETFDRLDATRRMFAEERVKRDLSESQDDVPDGD